MTAYRYLLHRAWRTGDDRRAVWIMLNPSTADAVCDDATIRRCIGFSTRIGAAGLVVVNLYAARARRPRDLRELDDPVGGENDRRIRGTLRTAAARSWPVICAWGTNAEPDRAAAVAEVVTASAATPWCLGYTAGGHPRHPLYLPYRTPLQPWRDTRERPRVARGGPGPSRPRSRPGSSAPTG